MSHKCNESEKFKDIPQDINFYWFNWQAVTEFLEDSLKAGYLVEGLLASDLYQLLVKKNLRAFHGFHFTEDICIKHVNEKIFFD